MKYKTNFCTICITVCLSVISQGNKFSELRNKM